MDPTVASVAILVPIASYSHTVGILFFMDCSGQLRLIANFVCIKNKTFGSFFQQNKMIVVF